MALDVGDRRIGIAVSDAMRVIAAPHSVYTRVGYGPDVRFLQRLYQELDEQCEAVICRCGGRVYPTFGIYRKGILPKVCAAVKEKDLRMMSLLDRISVRYAELDIGKELQNVNTPEDLERLQRAYERSHGACPHDLRNNLVKRV